MAMSDPLVPVGDGNTELSEQDREGLLPSYVATRGDLFDAEQRNIAEAMLRRRPTVDELLDDKYLRDLHREMFGRVWAWAGRYRILKTNIGFEPSAIPAAVHDLVADTRTWVEFGTYRVDELAVRFHHRLVALHPFPNGNGRHGRIATDFLVAALEADPFSWGSNLEIDTDHLRSAYVDALRSADGGNISKLLGFART
jgi:Fic-DOC domain mobile mystery protein B